jgi:CDP-diacylglycerol---glycerol-3-phosphate 3-phosphatidyltransferase
VTLRSRSPRSIESIITPIGRALARTGVTPNALTTLGILLTAAAAVMVASGRPVVGGWLLVAGGLMDTFDGAVARANGQATPFGSFYDSVSDRISDGIILVGIAFWLRDDPRQFALVMVALVAAQVTSYVRAKAESIDLDCSVGIFERAERAILLMLGLLFHQWLLEPVLWLLAIGSTVTVVQRVHHVWCQIDRDIPQDLLDLAARDRAWSRAFTGAARRFYGERNFDPAFDEHAANQRSTASHETDRGRGADAHGADAHGFDAPGPDAPRTQGPDGPRTHGPDGRTDAHRNARIERAASRPASGSRRHAAQEGPELGP